jgi:hypothetical protein
MTKNRVARGHRSDPGGRENGRDCLWRPGPQKRCSAKYDDDDADD